jgi:penicillin amidase
VRRAVRFVSGLVQLVVVVLILAIIAVVVMGAILTQRGWPQTTGTVVIDGLHHPVTVIRDGAGIIQITADDRHDLFLAQGYAHAQERMWQMEISRRIGAGRLSELFGAGQVDKDTYIRTLGWRQAAQRDLDAMSTDTKAILQAYSDGVNAWITEHDGKLSTPFVVAGLKAGIGGIGGYTLEPWTPLDTATWQKVQAWSLGGNVDSEVFRFLADAKLGDPNKTDELFPPYDPSMPVITATGAIGDGGANPGPGEPGPDVPGASPGASPGATSSAVSPGDLTALADLAHLGDSISAIAGFDMGGGLAGDHGVGSNNWVVAGSKTLSGKPLLANDPHLGFGMPSIWIINGLHCRAVSDSCPWDVVGVSFPGAPAVVLGHNAHIAWGATNVNPDTQDLYRETPDPADPKGHYLYKGSPAPYQVRHETIKVAGGADVEIDVRSTIHGPVLSDVDKRLKADPDAPIFALEWTTTSKADLALETFFKIDLASSFDEFHKAFDGYGSPSQNFIYADVDGHIGYVLPGLIPVRANGCDVDTIGCVPEVGGERVRNGVSGLEEWTGYIPFDQLPWQLDPAAGMIVSANNEAVDASYPFFIGNEWDPGYRAARITELLTTAPAKLTSDDFRKIQMDTEVMRGKRFVLDLASLGPKLTTEDGKVLWSNLMNWDYQCPVDSTGCAAFAPIEVALQRAIFDDELGPLAREWVGSTMSWEALHNVLADRDSAWWKDATPGAAPLSAAEVAGKAIDSVAADMRKAFGEPANWTWGKLHTVAFKEQTLGSSGIAPLEWYFDASARAVAGADGAIQNNYYQVSRAYPDPNDPDYVPLGIADLFSVTNGPSYRLAIDMNDLDGATVVITTGQSGNPFDGHYGDMIPLWASGGTVPLVSSPSLVAASAVQTLTLSPP